MVPETHQRKQPRRRSHCSTPALASSNPAAAAGTDKSGAPAAKLRQPTASPQQFGGKAGSSSAPQPINRQSHPQTHKPTKPHTQKPINPQITHSETYKLTKLSPKKSRLSAENRPSRKRGARNAPTQAAEAQKPLQHARAGQQQSRSRSRDRQIGPGAQPLPQQSCASQRQARNSLVAKREAAARHNP